MQKLTYKVSFTTPAFLGNAFQQAQWRTPPFKALLRQWWRVAQASEISYDVNKLRQREALLFGSVSDHGGSVSGKSKVLLKLSEWQEGKLSSWQNQSCGSVYHQEVQGGRNVGADLYLGYGPLTYEKGQCTLSKVKDTQIPRTAIMPEEEEATLTVIAPDAYMDEVSKAIQLTSWFGTLGSRSRNGWGSLKIIPSNGTLVIKELSKNALAGYTRHFPDCMEEDWPHALGSDERGPLVWQSNLIGSWRDVIKELATIKVVFRTQVSIKNNKDIHGPVFDDRHLLAYPVTHHGVQGWIEMDRNFIKKDRRGYSIQSERLANQLRFKVIKVGDQCRGLIFHLPCSLPSLLAGELDNAPSKQKQINIWRRVHGVLDDSRNGLSRL